MMFVRVKVLFKILLKILIFPIKFGMNIMCFKLDYDLDRLEM